MDHKISRRAHHSVGQQTARRLDGSMRRRMKRPAATSIIGESNPSIDESLLPFVAVPPSGAASISPFLSSQMGTALERLRQFGVERDFPAGEYLYRQGEPPTSMHYMLSGRVRVFITRSNGSERTLCLAKPHTTFGEFAVFGDIPCPTSAVAVESSRVVVIDRAALVTAGAAVPELFFEIARQLAQKLRLLSMHLVTDGLPARTRAAMVLIELLDAHGVVCPNNTARLSGLYSVDDLAQVIGVTRVTMSRELSRLVARKIVAKRGREIIILDMAALRAAAEDYFA